MVALPIARQQAAVADAIRPSGGIKRGNGKKIEQDQRGLRWC